MLSAVSTPSMSCQVLPAGCCEVAESDPLKVAAFLGDDVHADAPRGLGRNRADLEAELLVEVVGRHPHTGIAATGFAIVILHLDEPVVERSRAP
jgi:hypothetical protein